MAGDGLCVAVAGCAGVAANRRRTSGSVVAAGVVSPAKRQRGVTKEGSKNLIIFFKGGVQKSGEKNGVILGRSL